jgi:hypothetical protein
MIAAVGFIVPGFVTFPETTGPVSITNSPTLEAAGGAPACLVQIFASMGYLEFKRINYIEKGADYMAGDSQA